MTPAIVRRELGPVLHLGAMWGTGCAKDRLPGWHRYAWTGTLSATTPKFQIPPDFVIKT